MSLNVRAHPFLYSASTYLAYKIAKRYYNDTHYVWCTTEFNSATQPPTSNPSTICKRYLEQIVLGDRHAKELDTNIAGILRGAQAKLNAGVISPGDHKEIREIVSLAEYKDFFPVVYIIRSSKVRLKCLEVLPIDRASDRSVEYKVEELKEGEFQVISFADILGGVVQVADKKVGR